jgi:hypothetical protein
VIDYKLTYPSGTATALLINSFHTNTGAELAGYVYHFLLVETYIQYSFYFLLPTVQRARLVLVRVM